MTQPSTFSRKTAYFFLLVNTLAWGAALVVAKPAFDTTTPFRFLLYRYGIAGLLSVPLLLHYLKKIHQKKLLKTKKIKTLVIIVALEMIGNVLALALLYSGLARTTAIEASLITTTMPIFVVLTGIFLLKEKQENHEWTGLSIAFVGTLLLTLFPLWQNQATQNGFYLVGNVLVLGQNIASALYFVLAKKYYQGLPKFFVTTISFYVSLVSFFFLSWWEFFNQLPYKNSLQAQDYFMPWKEFILLLKTDLSHPSVLLASVYMAVFGSIIGLTAYIKGQEGVEASEASLFWYLQPLVYLPLGMLFLGEKTNFIQIGSLALIVVGVVLAERRKPKKIRAHNTGSNYH